MKFTSLNQLNRFCQFIEDETRLYSVDYLGYPWYKLAKDNLNNTMSFSKPMQSLEAVRRKRVEDYLVKRGLLEERWDYVFISKAKMRRNDESNMENLLFNEIYDYLNKRGLRFFIFEEPSGQEYDLKYLKSKYAHLTIPLEFIINQPKILANQYYKRCKDYFINLIHNFFKNPPEAGEWADYIGLLKEKYFLYANEIPKILFWQELLTAMKPKALIGGMGTHFSAGLNNRFAVVEVGHGFPGEFRAVEPFTEKALRFHREHFQLRKLFTLTPAPTAKLPQENGLYLEENRFNYGMPELRAHQAVAKTAPDLVKKYALSGNFIILAATTGWVDYSALRQVLTAVKSAFPDAVILLRPHPNYDRADTCDMFQNLAIPVEKEHKYDLFSTIHAFISAPSSMAVEAQAFTDNIIVYPPRFSNEPEEINTLQRCYPFAAIASLDNPEKIIDLLRHFKLNPRKKIPKTDEFKVDMVLDELFRRIDASLKEDNNRISTPSSNHSAPPSILTAKESRLKRGEELYSQGDIAGAQAVFERLITDFPAYAEAYNNFGIIYLEMNMLAEGIKCFQQACRLDPDDTIAFNNYIEALKLAVEVGGS